MKLIALFFFSYLLISCETTSLQMGKKTIYEPNEQNQQIKDLEENKIRDFTNVTTFEGKNISSLQQKYGDFNFSKIEKTFEFHRYNAERCRIFIQNYANNKKIIHVTIYNLETKETYSEYQKNNCS